MMRLFIILALLVSNSSWALANDYYTHGSFPSPSSPATSSSMRAELDLISAGFEKLPAFAGNTSKPLIINAGGTAVTVTTGTLTLDGNFRISGAYSTVLTVTAATNVTLPTAGTLATVAGSETLTTKTINLTSNTLTGTTAQFNTALSDNDFATLAGVETLTNKTLTAPAIAAPVLSGSTTGTYTLAGTPTITGPTISSPILSGSATGTYTLAGTPTITGPTISNPTISGTSNGTYSLGGTISISSPTITTPSISAGVVTADPASALGIAPKQYVDASNRTIATKVALYTVVAGDAGKVIDVNGTFTVSFTAAATLGTGFHVWVRNIGSGNVTLDPNASETIDGVTTATLYPGNMYELLSDGSNFRTMSGRAGEFPVGQGQTYQDQTASRANATNYTNTTGRTIFVSVWLTNSSGGAQTGSLSVSGVAINNNGCAIGGETYSLQALVPAGAVYRIDAAGTLTKWFELVS